MTPDYMHFGVFLKRKKVLLTYLHFLMLGNNKGNHHHVSAILLEDSGKFLIQLNHHAHTVLFSSVAIYSHNLHFLYPSSFSR